MRVPGLLSIPTTPPRGAVLLQHGGGESKEDPLIHLLMRRWGRAGFACLAIDAPGHGERAISEAHRSPRRGFYEYMRSRVQNVIDLRRGLDALGELGLSHDGAGYWGVSMGGSVGVMLLASESRVAAACLCLAGARSRRSWPDIDPDVADFAARNLDPLALAAAISRTPVLMLNGTDDPTIAREDAERLYQALAGPKEQRWFKTGHKVTVAMLRASGEFFERELGR